LLSKETYVNQKRPAYIKRDICNPKETITMAKGCLICHAGKSSVMLSKETYVNQKRPVEILKKKFHYLKGLLDICHAGNRSVVLSKETYIRNSSVLIVFKRGLCRSKETCVNQKRPSQFERAARYMPRGKQVCFVVKRDQSQK